MTHLETQYLRTGIALHDAAIRGSTEKTCALLESGGARDIDKLGEGKTPLMWAARLGYARVARILLNKGAGVSVAGEGGFTALHDSAHHGHLAVTKMLVKAGADLEAGTAVAGATPLCAAAQEGHLEVVRVLVKAGADLEAKTVVDGTPLYMAAAGGHSEVMSALMTAGANVNSRQMDGSTPLCVAAQNGHLDAVRMLLSAEADPVLPMIQGKHTTSPLDMASQNGRVEVVRELIRQLGIEGCGGARRGEQALCAAARGGHVTILAVLLDAGVVDTGPALRHATGNGHETATKFLLGQRRSSCCKRSYVNNSSKDRGQAALLCAIGFVEISSSPYPRIVRLLVDAGADTASTFRLTDPGGTVLLNDTVLAGTTRLIREKRVGVNDATVEQLNKLEEIRRLLLRVEAVHAVSFLWPSSVVPTPAVSTTEGTNTTETTAARLTTSLPLLRRSAGARRVFLKTLFRWVMRC